jgi:hypothetical protein
MTRGLTVLEPGEPSTPAADTPRPVGEPGDTADPDASGDTPRSLTGAITLLETMPGVEQRGAELLVAAWGTELQRFGTASHLSAWTGVAPGHDASAGKQRSDKTRQGHRTRRTGLTHIAHAAVRTKGTYLSAVAPPLAARQGTPRAIPRAPMPSSSGRCTGAPVRPPRASGGLMILTNDGVTIAWLV